MAIQLDSVVENVEPHGRRINRMYRLVQTCRALTKKEFDTAKVTPGLAYLPQ